MIRVSMILSVTLLLAGATTQVCYSADPAKIATFGGGCFWCVEAVFEAVPGVETVESGYMGGRIPNPTYAQVSSSRSGHAEVCQIRFDPNKVSYEKLLEIFWKTHDPTTKNRQGHDIGPQYRSIIFYHDEEQEKLSREYKTLLNKKSVFKRPVVTLIEEGSIFYPAEMKHQDYFRKNPSSIYCIRNVVPKLKKLRSLVPADIKVKE